MHLYGLYGSSLSNRKELKRQLIAYAIYLRHLENWPKLFQSTAFTAREFDKFLDKRRVKYRKVVAAAPWANKIAGQLL